VREDDLGRRRTGVADLGERAAQSPPAGVLRRRGRRRVAWITAIALAVVLSIGLAGLALRAHVGLDQVAVNPSAGSIPLPLVSDLGPIVGIQLLDATSGWALTAGRLVWTDTGGASWRTITPAGADGLDLLTPFFLDLRTGWLVAADLPGDGRPTELTAFRTVDGGTTWQRSTMGSASVQQSEDGTGPMNLSFVDGRHGWLRVTSRLPGQRAEEETGTLLRTSNGGRTWERLPDAPTPGSIRFVTRQRGWQAWLDALWETRDGGRTWVAVPSLAAAPGQGAGWSSRACPRSSPTAPASSPSCATAGTPDWSWRAGSPRHGTAGRPGALPGWPQADPGTSRPWPSPALAPCWSSPAISGPSPAATTTAIPGRLAALIWPAAASRRPTA
jgi:hypothetical protein